MKVRVQLTAATLGGTFRETLKRQDLCTPSVDGEGKPLPVIVDRVEVGDQSQFAVGSARQFTVSAGNQTTTVGGNAVAYRQNITIFTTDVQSLIAANGKAPNASSNTLSIAMDVTFDVVNGSTVLTLTYAGAHAPVPFDDSVLNDDQKQQLGLVDAILKAQLPPVSIPLDLSGVAAQLGVNVTAVQAGIACDRDGSHASELELRVEFGTSGSNEPSAWQDFYTNGLVDDFSNGDDWAILLSSDLVTTAVQQKIKDGLAGKADIKVNSGPDASWSVENGVGVVTSKANVDAIDACSCFGFDIDVNADLTITVRLTEQQGQLLESIHLDRDADDLELFCCELTAVFAWPFAGLTGDVDFGDWFLGVILGPAFSFGYAVNQATKPPQVDLGATCTQNDSDITCLVPVDLNGPPPGPCDPPRVSAWSLGDVRGRSDGLVLSGPATIFDAKAPAIDVAVTPFSWVPPSFDCSSVDGGFVGLAEIDVTQQSGDAPWRFCSAVAIGDTAAAYNPGISVTFDYCPYRPHVLLQVEPNAVPTGPAQVLVHTSAGTRVVAIAAPAPLTQQEVDAFNQYVTKWRLETCFTIPDPWWQHFRRFNPKWSIDPGPEGVNERQGWAVQVQGAPAGAGVAVQDGAGNTLAEGRAGAEGALAMHFTAAKGAQLQVVPRAAGADAAHVEAAGGTARRGDGNGMTGGLRFRQVRLVERAVAGIGDDALDVGLAIVDGAPALLVVHPNTVDVFGLDRPTAPRLLRQLELPETLDGARWSRGAFAGWAGDRPFAIDARGAVALGAAGEPVRDAAIEGDRSFVLTVAGDLIMSSRRDADAAGARPAARVSVRGATTIAPCGAFVAVGGDGPLRLVDTRDPASGATVDDVTGVARLHAIDRRSRAILAELAGGRWAELTVDAREPRVVDRADHVAVPDLLLGRRAGSLVVTRDPTSPTVRIEEGDKVATL